MPNRIPLTTAQAHGLIDAAYRGGPWHRCFAPADIDHAARLGYALEAQLESRTAILAYIPGYNPAGVRICSIYPARARKWLVENGIGGAHDA